MNDKVNDTDPLLDIERVKSQMQDYFIAQLDAAQEILLWGVDLFKRAIDPRSVEYCDAMIIAVLFRQALVSYDASILCIENGALDAAMIHNRSLFETRLYLDWILTQDKERWGNQFYVSSLRRMLIWHENILSDPDNIEKLGVFATDEEIKGKSRDEIIAEIERIIKGVNRELENEAFKQINEDFEKRRGNRKREPYWYQPGVGGIQNLYLMAKKLGLEALYEGAYQWSTYFSHGSFAATHTVIRSDGMFTVKPIRNLEDLPFVFEMSIIFIVDILRLIIAEYRAGERSLEEKLKEWSVHLGMHGWWVEGVYRFQTLIP